MIKQTKVIASLLAASTIFSLTAGAVSLPKQHQQEGQIELQADFNGTYTDKLGNR